MQFYATISPLDPASPFTREAWLAYVAESHDLARPEPRIGRNPANGQQIALQPPADTAHLTVDGEHVASFGWASNDDHFISVAFNDPHREAVVKRANEVAAAIGGVFKIEHEADNY